jgi:hypothetical protein
VYFSYFIITVSSSGTDSHAFRSIHPLPVPSEAGFHFPHKYHSEAHLKAETSSLPGCQSMQGVSTLMLSLPQPVGPVAVVTAHRALGFPGLLALEDNQKRQREGHPRLSACCDTTSNFHSSVLSLPATEQTTSSTVIYPYFSQGLPWFAGQPYCVEVSKWVNVNKLVVQCLSSASQSQAYNLSCRA